MSSVMAKLFILSQRILMRGLMPKKVRAVYYDTNVFIEASLGEGEPGDDSRFALSLAEQNIVVCVGSTAIKRELGFTHDSGLRRLLLSAYESIAHIQVSVRRDTRRVAHKYTEDMGVKGMDALHLALASLGRADVFLSWNREDIVKATTIEALRKINRSLRIPTPEIMTPSEFRERIRYSIPRRTVILC